MTTAIKCHSKAMLLMLVGMLGLTLPAFAQQPKFETRGLPGATAMPLEWSSPGALNSQPGYISPGFSPGAGQSGTAMPPEWSPQFGGPGPTGPTSKPSFCISPDIFKDVPKCLPAPRAARGFVGLFNSSSQPLKFELAVGTERRPIDLGPSEIITVQIPDNVELKGIIGTGTNDHITALSKGEIYVLRAHSGNWVFSKF